MNTKYFDLTDGDGKLSSTIAVEQLCLIRRGLTTKTTKDGGKTSYFLEFVMVNGTSERWHFATEKDCLNAHISIREKVLGMPAP